jgi:hypothetical protein
MNDSDAVYCAECGRPLLAESKPSTAKPRKAYLYALLLVPVIALAAGVGYYKFFLPQGVAAVVNGEEIKLSELEAEVVRTQGSSTQPADSRLRYQILNALITERLALQAARRADIEVSREELQSAVAEARTSSGMSEAEFDRRIAEQYGDMQGFEKAYSRRLLINKYIAEKIVPPGADPQTARESINQWMQRLSGTAAVRITLAEQWSGAGCGCCGKGGNAAAPQAGPGNCRASSRGVAFASDKTSPSSQADKASDAALRYWQEKHGNEKVTAKVKDYGCHMEIDIVKDDKVIGSLRYQGGRISER